MWGEDWVHRSGHEAVVSLCVSPSHPDSYSCTMEFKFKRKPNPGTARSRRESFVPGVHTCAIAKQKWVLWVYARWQRQSGLTVGSNHDVIVSDIGNGTCLPLFGVGPRSPIKAHKQLVTCACCWVAWTTDLLKLWAKAFLKMGFLPDPGPIHCLTGPKAYISQKSQDQEMLRQN